MNLKKLLEQIEEYEEYQAQRENEAKQYEERLEVLAKARKEVFDLVANDNRNDVAHIQLDQDDAEIASLKTTIQEHQQETRSLLHSMRTKIFQTQEKASANLKSDLEKKQETQVRLKKELIPKAEARLASLFDKQARTQDSIKQIRKESRKVARLNLDHLG